MRSARFTTRHEILNVYWEGGVTRLFTLHGCKAYRLETLKELNEPKRDRRYGNPDCVFFLFCF